jgi:hypothetical protein
MVYCDYIENTKKTVTYSYGQTIDDMTGEVEYNFENDVLKIKKSPVKYKVISRHLESVLKKHRREFINGELKKKIAYEA